MRETTTIRVSKETAQILNNLKIDPNQSADDVLNLVLSGKLEDLKRVSEQIRIIKGSIVYPSTYFYSFSTTLRGVAL